MKRLVLAAGLLVCGTGQANAGLLSLTPVSGSLQSFQTPPPPGSVAANDVIPGLWGYLNGNLYLNGAFGADYRVTFTLVGSESGWTNRLTTQGGLFLEEPTHLNQSISYLTTGTGAPQLLNFKFQTTAGSTQPDLVNGPAGAGQVANGGVGNLRTFFVSFCIDKTQGSKQQKNLACNTADLNPGLAGVQTSTTGDIAWLALDDSGAGPNDNHDDWVGYVEVTQVPDGGVTLSMLGVALTGLVALRRKFSA